MNRECEHEWVSNSGRGGEPIFKENGNMSTSAVMHVKCDKCGARTWLSEDDWNLLESNVIDLQDHHPHLTIPTKNAVHVLPVALIKDVIDGKKLIFDIDGWEDILPVILSDYLKGMEMNDD